MNKDKEREFFDQFGNKEYDVFTDKGYAKIIAQFYGLVKPKPGEKLVDFGCGTGSFTRYLLPFNLNLTGIDISPQSIRNAKSNHPDINFIVGDIEKTNYPDNSVDIIVFSGVLHHFDDFSKTILEAHRILKPGGRIFAYDPNKNNPIMWLYRDERSPFSSKKGRTDNERLLSVSELKIALKSSNFKNLNISCISGVTFKYVESRLGLFVLPLYNLIESVLGTIFISKKIGSFIITYAEK